MCLLVRQAKVDGTLDEPAQLVEYEVLVGLDVVLLGLELLLLVLGA